MVLEGSHSLHGRCEAVPNGSGIAFVGKQSRIVKRFDNRGNTMFSVCSFLRGCLN